MKTLPILFATTAIAAAGPYSPAVGVAGSDAIPWDDPSFVLWADGIDLVRGPVDSTMPGGAVASYGDDADALGPADAFDPVPERFPVVSLGDGGTATLTFAQPLADGPGPDFAVFENSFNDAFIELAFVEVSSDGAHFARLPAVSLTSAATQVSSFGLLDPTDIHNLAGKHRAGYGTPFDLSEIDDALVNLTAVTHVRIVDVVGSVHPLYATTDSLGNIVNDPYPTVFPSGGFDLDAVGVIHAAPASFADWSQLVLDGPGTSFTADSDQDGLSEGLEWALWSDPRQTSAPLALSPAPGGFSLEFPFHASRSPSVMRIEASGGFDSWTPVAVLGPAGWESAASGISVSTDGGFPATISVQSSSTAFRYFRCHIEQ